MNQAWSRKNDGPNTYEQFHGTWVKRLNWFNPWFSFADANYFGTPEAWPSTTTQQSVLLLCLATSAMLMPPPPPENGHNNYCPIQGPRKHGGAGVGRRRNAATTEKISLPIGVSWEFAAPNLMKVPAGPRSHPWAVLIRDGLSAVWERHGPMTKTSDVIDNRPSPRVTNLFWTSMNEPPARFTRVPRVQGWSWGSPTQDSAST